MQFLENIFHTLIEQALPTACVICEQFQQSILCNNCAHELRCNALWNYQCCSQCGNTLKREEVDRGTCHSCRTRPPHFDLSYCLDRYDGLLQNALHQLKYQKRIVFAHGLAHAWNIVMSKELQNIEASYLLPVPLSEEKLAIRGFNQSWELARRIDHNRSIRKLPNALKRYHRTTQQAGNSWDTRLIQIQDSFYLESKAIPLLRNQSVVVFDDVMTSGATLDEIARVLKDNGVSRVTNWVLLRATKSI